jgi:hypothetical protein
MLFIKTKFIFFPLARTAKPRYRCFLFSAKLLVDPLISCSQPDWEMIWHGNHVLVLRVDLL